MAHTDLFLEDLQNWFKLEQLNSVDQLKDNLFKLKSNYRPSNKNPAFRILATIQRLSDNFLGLEIEAYDGKLGYLYNFSDDGVDLKIENLHGDTTYFHWSYIKSFTLKLPS